MYVVEPMVNVPPVKLSSARPKETFSTVAVSLMLALWVLDWFPILKAVPDPLIIRTIPFVSGAVTL